MYTLVPQLGQQRLVLFDQQQLGEMRIEQCAGPRDDLRVGRKQRLLRHYAVDLPQSQARKVQQNLRA